MRNLLFAVCMSLVSLLGSSAHAYQYNYVSDVFHVEFGAVSSGSGGPWTTVIQYSVITAHIFTPTLLTAGSTWAPGTVIYMNRFVNDSVLWDQLVDPNPNADPNSPPGSVWNPYLTATMNIGGVGADGLPTMWDISLQSFASAPTGRHEISNLFISNTGDSVSGGYEGFSAYSGASTGPGSWSMGAAAIPEPETYAMLLAGLGLLGVAVRRRL